MGVSVLIKVPSTFAELALSLQTVFPNHLLGSSCSGLSRRDLLGAVWGCRNVHSRFRVICMLFGASLSKPGPVPATYLDQRSYGWQPGRFLERIEET